MICRYSGDDILRVLGALIFTDLLNHGTWKKFGNKRVFFINMHSLYLVQRGWDFRTQMPMDGKANGTPERPVGRDVGFRGGAGPGIC